MSSNNRRLIFNTRERLLSTDLNDATALLHAKGTDEIAAVTSGDLYKSTVPVSGVVAGLIAVANGANLTIEVSAGIGFKNDTPPTSLDSPYQKIETLGATAIDLTAFVDPANPRWVAIDVAPGDTPELVSARDIFQPALGTFIPANVDKIRRPEPVFSVNAGVASPTPVLPSGTPGVVPLAYVYLPAAAGLILASDVIICRSRLNTATLGGAFHRGKGGINVNAAGSTLGQFKEYVIKFTAQGAVSGVANATVSDAALVGDPNWVVGESFPVGTSAPLYAYLVKAPYPSGYDSDVSANREFIDASGRIPSNPFAGATNGLIVWSALGPANPAAVGAHPSGVVGLNDATWGGGTTAFTSYLGAVLLSDIAPAGFATQLARGDRVRITEAAKTPEDLSTHSGSSVVGALGGLRSMSPLLNSGVAGKAIVTVFPEALEYDIAVTEQNLLGSNYGFELRTTEDFTTTEPGALNAPVSHGYLGAGLATDIWVRRYPYVLRTPTSGACTYDHFEIGGGVSNFFLATVGYQDKTLAQR